MHHHRLAQREVACSVVRVFRSLGTTWSNDRDVACLFGGMKGMDAHFWVLELVDDASCRPATTKGSLKRVRPQRTGLALRKASQVACVREQSALERSCRTLRFYPDLPPRRAKA
jgi:hypothetical protein